MRIFLFALFAFVCAVPAGAAPVLFSDLGTGNDVYGTQYGYAILGSGNSADAFQSVTEAFAFPVSGSGSELVSQIDIAMQNVQGPGTFSLSIWTDISGQPGTQLPNSFWSLSTSIGEATCCQLVSVMGISGVALTGGSTYLLVVGPASLSNDSYNIVEMNSQGFLDNAFFSNNGGGSWTSAGPPATLGAFDVLSAPEPGTFSGIGVGIVGLFAALRHNRIK